MQHLETETVVVGAGMIGMSIALELARSGQIVHVVDRASSWGAEASGAAAGMLAPQHEADAAGLFLDLYLEARDLWVDMASDLLETTGIDPCHRADGFLYLALNSEEWILLRERAEWQQRSGLPVEVLAPNETVGRFPMVSADIAGAIFHHGDHHLHTSHALDAYAAACRAAGVQFIFDSEVSDLIIERHPDGGRVAGIHTKELHLTAARTVLAAGAWTGRLTAALGAPLPVEPVRGQAVVVTLEHELLPCLAGSSLGYLVPRGDGEILAGATSEHVGFDRNTTEAGVNSVWEAATLMIPELTGRRPSQQWAGLRPGSPDGQPILGPLPGMGDLWIATAHFRNGILLAPLTGRIMKGWITTGDPGIDPTPLLPDRFLF
jgi:glycine oxidase